MVAVGGLNYLLHAGDEGSEGGHHHPAGRVPDGPVQGLPYDLFGEGVARHLGVGGVGKQQQNSFGAVAGQESQVYGVPVHGGVVDLEIPGVDDRSQGGGDGQAHGVGNAVADPEPGDLEVLPEPIGNAGFDSLHLGPPGGPVLPKLHGDQAMGQFGGVHWHREVGQNEG